MDPVVKDTVWTGLTARELRHHPADVREVLFYLLTAPERNPYGLYIVEPAVVLQRIGTRPVPVERSLEILESVQFCRWDPASGWVWVYEMARIQFAAPLKAADYKCRSIRRWYRQSPRNPFLGAWFDRYVTDFHLIDEPDAAERRTDELGGKPLPSPSQGAPKPLRTEHVRTFALESQEPVQSVLVPPDPATVPFTAAALEAAFEQIWDDYPNGHEKKNAIAEFKKLKPTPALVARIHASIIEHRRTPSWTKDGGQFVPRLVNFLKNAAWLDRVAPTQPMLTERTARNVAAVESVVARLGKSHD